MNKKPDKEGNLLGEFSDRGAVVRYSHTCLFQSMINLWIILQITKRIVSQNKEGWYSLIKKIMF